MKNLRQKIESLSLNFAKEMSILAVVNALLIGALIAMFFINLSILVIIAIGVTIVVFNLFYLNRYNTMILNKEKKLDNEFIEIFSYLRIYLYNEETVYTSLKNISEFASPKMKERLEQLLSDIDDDKTVQPFITFARLFQNKVIEEVMIALYEMVNSGNKDIYLNQFIKVFEDFKTRNEEENEEKRYRKFDTLNMLSIVGSGYIMVILALCIVLLLGEATNGF